MAAPMPGRCSFYVEKKKRFCKMIVGNGKKFCGEHGNMEEGSSSRRIVCPLDPKHTVSEDRLDTHLKKCNARDKPKPVYYVEDINAGSADADQLQQEMQQQVVLCQTSSSSHLLMPRPQSFQQVCLSERSSSELRFLLQQLNAAVKGLRCELKLNVASHPILQEELNNPKNGDSASKHLKQQSSILGHLEALRLLAGRRCFVEFGAGRGKLSHWIHEALKTCKDLHFLLVERSSTRFKVDGRHQDGGAEFERLQVDIQHLDLSKVPLLRHNDVPLVGVGKHLCGAATDLALRCLLERSGSSKDAVPPCKRLKPSEKAAEPGPDMNPGLTADPKPASDLKPASDQSEEARGSEALAVLGLAVALCCHHRCEWRHYVGKEFFLQKGLGAAEFAAFCRMSSWATCGLRPANQDRPPPNQTNQKSDEEEHEPVEEMDADTCDGFASLEERERIGRLCKLLIDSGRLHFLQRKGFDGKLTRYVSTQVTLENILLTAVPATSSKHDS
ncbi:hypothetical protein LDENG_00065640 [Lucifuga dentata]|nr:hypothetical protein LDENG_00065640 [Lucifuga dentata]